MFVWNNSQLLVLGLPLFTILKKKKKTNKCKNFLEFFVIDATPRLKNKKKRKKSEKKTLVGMLGFYVLWKVNNCIDVFFLQDEVLSYAFQ